MSTVPESLLKTLKLQVTTIWVPTVLHHYWKVYFLEIVDFWILLKIVASPDLEMLENQSMLTGSVIPNHVLKTIISAKSKLVAISFGATDKYVKIDINMEMQNEKKQIVISSQFSFEKDWKRLEM